MITKRKCRTLIGNFIIFALAVFGAGCGGDGGGGETPPPKGNEDTPPIIDFPVRSEDIFPDPGIVVRVEVGQTAFLDGSGSKTSAKGDLAYAWSFNHRPDGSKTVLQNATTVAPSFLADVRGTYMVQLVVSVGGVAGEPVIGAVEATNDYSPNIPRPDHTKNTYIKFRSQCVDCHIGGPGQVVGKSADHIDSSNLCQACHTIFGFSIIPYMDHEQVSGDCSSCHNGIAAFGKSDQHQPTTKECDECHTPTSFFLLEADGSYDHTEISTGCDRCHNAVLAIGMDDDHLFSTSDCVMCHSTDAFKPATFDHSEFTDNCARSGCHDGLSGVTGQPDAHPDINSIKLDCVACHNIKTFALGDTFDHAAVISSELACSACHDGVNAVAIVKTQDHIETSADCGMCHKTESFKPAFVDHKSEVVTGTVGNLVRCDSCHNNTDVPGLPVPPAQHMPINEPEDCGDRCHTPGTFSSGVFDHKVNDVLINQDCVSCHDDVIAAGKPVTHIPTIEDCSVCHVTDSFAAVDFTHAGIDLENCALCHDGVISTGKDRNHLPTTQDCSVCHGADFNRFATGEFHINVVVTENCASCHDRVIATGKPRRTHIPTQDDCIVCHTIGAFEPAKFLTDVHTNITSDCVECHNGEFTTPNVEVSGKSPNHMATSNLCEACHTISSFATVDEVDHGQVFGACSECHNGERAIGKSDQHVPTNGECDDCHTSTTSFLFVELDGSYDHTGITSSCSRCHDGILAIGKDVGHMDTTSECIACHTTDAFKPAIVDHTNLIDNCARSGCHTGLANEATGQPTAHPDTNAINLDCVICHNTKSFLMGNVFDHSAIISTELACEACHGGVNAVAVVKTPNHLVTTTDCGMCHNTEVFNPAFVDHSSEVVTGIGVTCESCHNNVPVLGKHDTHMPTTKDCDVCHTPGTFTTGFFDHTVGDVPIETDCASCHNEVIVAGAPVDHIPTTVDCSVCHVTDTFAGVIFTHTGIDVNNCALCHDGVISTGKDRNHLPTTEDCSVCHKEDFTTFTTGAFHINVVVTENCASCHDSVITTGKPKTTHIPTQDDCNLCHDTSAFEPSKFYATVHVDITRGCEGCHNGQFTTPNVTVAAKPNGHLPTNQDCHNCHTTAAFTPSTFTHVGISGNCVSCHDGNYVGVGATGVTDTVVHSNAANAGTDCAACHNTQAFIPAFVDHTSAAVTNVTCISCHDGINATGKDDKLDGPHVSTNQDCDVCHVPGGTFAPAVFDHSNLPRNTRCDSCHGVSATGMDAKTNPPHVQTTEDCSVCHNTTAFAGAKFNHQGIVDNCASCHGDTATGKPTSHVPTNDDCGICHVTTGFVPATFDHVGIVDNCESCHDGIFATGKSNNHPATNQDCGVCHTTDTFAGAGFDHTGILNDCARSGCHGDGATGMDAKTNPPHIPTTLDCSNCHTTATFVGGKWDHGNDSAGRCLDCHITGGGATVQPTQGHFDTGGTMQCDACHTTNSWAPANQFDHCPNTNADTCNGSDYPGDHKVGKVSCISCHTNNSATVTYPDQDQYKPFCAGCHAGDFKPKDKHNGGKTGTIEQNKGCGDTGCHKVSDGDF